MASYAERRRHHRVAQREAQKNSGKVYSIPKKHTNYLVGAAAVCSALFLMIGTFIGLFIARD